MILILGLTGKVPHLICNLQGQLQLLASGLPLRSFRKTEVSKRERHQKQSYSYLWSLHFSRFWILFRGTSFPFVCPTEPIISYVHEKEGSEVSNDLNLYINTSTGFKIKPIVTSQACQHLKTLLWHLSGFQNKFVLPNHISEQFNIFKSQAKT